VAASLGFEPRQRDPESLVLPLHHEAKGSESYREICKIRDFRVSREQADERESAENLLLPLICCNLCVPLEATLLHLPARHPVQGVFLFCGLVVAHQPAYHRVSHHHDLDHDEKAKVCGL
jgi:hypothetical protein